MKSVVKTSTWSESLLAIAMTGLPAISCIDPASTNMNVVSFDTARNGSYLTLLRSLPATVIVMM